MSVYIIAEVGVNHNGSVEIAKKLIHAAKESGCDCVKFQTFKAEDLVTNSAPKAAYQIENTKNSNETQYDMLKKLELSFQEFNELKIYCDELGIDFLSTPFDEKSVDLLEKINVGQYKLSSGDLTNKPLLEYIAKKNKRILLSTGMADLNEVIEAVNWIREAGNEDIVLFHCTSNYPAPFESVNMNAMLTLKEELCLPVGYSDHTSGIEVSLMAVSMGATIIEKHFTLDKEMEGPDHKASITPKEMKNMVSCIRNIEKAFGSYEKKPSEHELQTQKVARKSLVYANDLKKGDVIKRENLICKRPGTGIQPKYLEQFIGQKTNKDCRKNTLVSDTDFNVHN